MEIMVSVVMVTYNHAQYIRQALDSILMQKVNFKYEIVIGDDCSSDNNQEIIREYADKYPNIIKPILRERNIGAAQNSLNVRTNCSGKYLAHLEGDDYWIDENKLQLQVDFLESHPEVFSVAHRNEKVDINGEHIDYNHSNLKLDCYFNKKDVMKYRAGLFHTSTVMYRNFYKNTNNEFLLFRNAGKYSGLTLLVFYLATKSDIYIISRPMSAYRYVVVPDGTNYSSFANNDPIEGTYYLFVLYINLRKYLKHEYNLNNAVCERALDSILSILRSNLKNSIKLNKVLIIFDALNLNDITILITIVMKKIMNKVKRKCGINK